MSRIEEIKERFEIASSEYGWREDAWLNIHAKKDVQSLLAEIEKRDRAIARCIEYMGTLDVEYYGTEPLKKEIEELLK